MNSDEAAELLESELAVFRAEPYRDLVRRIPEGTFVSQRTGASGVRYQLEVQVVWDDGPGGDIRVAGAIDDGGYRAFVPLVRDFIKTPGDSFIGE